MNKFDVYNYLNNLNIRHQITEHDAVYNMAALSQIDMPYPEADAKTSLFVTIRKEIIIS